MNRLSSFLVVSLAVLCLLLTAGPTLVALAQATVPLAIALGVVVAALRLVLFHTRRW